MNKHFLIPLTIIIGGAVIGGALLFVGKNSNNPAGANVAQTNLRKVDLEIKNMFCVGCRSSVVNSVMALDGVIQADADPSTDSGWIIYDSSKITKEEILSAPIFQAYPAKILDDKKYSGTVQNGQTTKIPPEVEQKLNLLAQKLKKRGVNPEGENLTWSEPPYGAGLEPFFQKELDDAINGGYWDKANNLLDNLLKY